MLFPSRFVHKHVIQVVDIHGNVAPPAIAALPGIVETLGPNVQVFLDGGVRRGVHVFKALALGAHAVAVGRPTLYSLVLGGAPGVKSMFEALKTELQLTMKLAGCAKISDISRKYVT
jgi:lactate oxidase